MHGWSMRNRHSTLPERRGGPGKAASAAQERPLPQKGGFLLLLPCKMKHLFFLAPTDSVRFTPLCKENEISDKGTRNASNGLVRSARGGGGEGMVGGSTSMVASGALLRRLRWLRTCRCRRSCRRRCFSGAAPAFPAAAVPSRNSAAATASATKHARAAAMGTHQAVPFGRRVKEGEAGAARAGGRGREGGGGGCAST